ncbi:MAG: trehalose-6-phosphate synthase, partial [Myxococcales bacterium]|nr:trehalose-6-phosphate synthase [Myxococcales bacterium]
MRRRLRFLAALMVGLALVGWVGYFALTRTTRAWFESDLALRSQLAVVSARESLARHWTSDPDRLKATLADITRDERIMAAAACSSSGDQLAATDSYPIGFSCRSLLDRMRAEGP